MGMMQLKYLFANEPPTCLTLVERISCMAAETINFEEDGAILTCPVMDDYLWLLPIEQFGQRGYTVCTLALGGSYLVDALVTVIRAAGGVGPAPRHDVSGRSWQDAQTLYPH
jgi:hypothetical protein